MNRYTGRKNGAVELNKNRLEKSKDIMDKVNEKYEYIDDSMKSAVVASLNNMSGAIKGCSGLEQGKVNTIYVVGKKDNMLDIIAVDGKGACKRGSVEAAKVYSTMDIAVRDEANNKECEVEER